MALRTPPSQSLQHAHFVALFRATNLASEQERAFHGSRLISRGADFFLWPHRRPFRWACPSIAPCACPPESDRRQGPQETHCTARVVHVRNETLRRRPQSDFGAENREITTPRSRARFKTEDLKSNPSAIPRIGVNPKLRGSRIVVFGALPTVFQKRS